MSKGLEKLALDPSLGVPLYRQIVEGIRVLIAADVLKEGQKLPPLRALAIRLRVNPNSVARAYRELVRAGALLQTQGQGTFVSPEPNVAAQSRNQILRREVRHMVSKARSLGCTKQEVLKAVQDRLRIVLMSP